MRLALTPAKSRQVPLSGFGRHPTSCHLRSRGRCASASLGQAANGRSPHMLDEGSASALALERPRPHEEDDRLTWTVTCRAARLLGSPGPAPTRRPTAASCGQGDRPADARAPGRPPAPPRRAVLALPSLSGSLQPASHTVREGRRRRASAPGPGTRGRSPLMRHERTNLLAWCVAA